MFGMSERISKALIESDRNARKATIDFCTDELETAGAKFTPPAADAYRAVILFCSKED